ncbi:MAG TPA: phosphopentomutase [Solirubrobacteraceae bacterium]|nr:phosphopentomutase [Solirubrobacteraceae bacterium]
MNPSRRRAFVVTLDACGVGALPDAADYGDAGADTLAHLAELVGGLRLPTLARLGLGEIGSPIAGLATSEAPAAIHGRLAPDGPGKDSTSGHWELMGAGPTAPMPTYPDGFPRELVATLERITGARFCCNKPYNGLEALVDFGEHHLRTGELILYTSQDSVLQLAAHVDRMPADALVATCRLIRGAMAGEHAVGRVIARPFAGAPGAFARVEGRRDLSLTPAGPTVLDLLDDAGVAVHGVGKVVDLFGGRGIAQHHEAHGNGPAIDATTELIAQLDAGMVFTNLIDTDQLYAHRKDVAGFHAALREIDEAVSAWLRLLRDGDLLVLTADHGCDPAAEHSDHTREYVPLLATGPGVAATRHDGAMADVGATVHGWLTGRAPAGLPGTSFI